MEKRGQLTAFVILGIIIVFLVGILFFFRLEIINNLSDISLFKAEVLPPKAESVKDVVISCINEIGEEGVTLLGLQGGYITLPEDRVPIGNANMFSNKLQVLPSLSVAYWLYQKENSIEVVEFPTKDDMEKSLEGYMEENLEACIGDFEQFPDYKITKMAPRVKVEIKDDSVIYGISMPITVNIGEESFKFSKFTLPLEYGLGKLQEIAEDIVRNEAETMYLEEKTYDIMVAYDKIPLSGIDLQCAPKVWLESAVRNDFKSILSDNIPHLRVDKTHYKLSREENSYFVWPITFLRHKDISVNFLFSKAWPFDMDIFPTEGGLMKSEPLTAQAGELGSIMQSIACMSQYNFIYDVKYPVLVSVKDRDSDYTLQFAMQVVIARNQPREALIVPETPEELDRKYCENAFAESTIDIYSENTDGSTDPLEGTYLRLQCINHNCEIGYLEDKSTITTKIPSCINGRLIAEKVGYHRAADTISTNEPFSTSLYLQPYVNMSLKVHVDRAAAGGVSGNPTKDQKVIIELSDEDQEFSTMAIYPDTRSINLIPGDYKVKILLISDSGRSMKLPKQEIKTCVDVPKQGFIGVFFGGTEKKCSTTTIPATEVTELIRGGAEFDWSVSRSDLTYDFVKFFIKSSPPPGSIEDLGKIDLEQKGKEPVFLDE